MKNILCISKKTTYVITVAGAVVFFAFLFGPLFSSHTVRFTPRASEPMEKSRGRFLASRKQVAEALSTSVHCGGDNEPICLTADAFYCEKSDLKAYTKPVNKTFNQECRVDFNYSLVENWYPENNPNMTWEEKIDAVVDVFSNNRYPQYQPYEHSFVKSVSVYGEPTTITVLGIDPGQICRHNPYYMTEIPEVCPIGQMTVCGRAGQPCCITQAFVGDDYDFQSAAKTKYRFECENASLRCDRSDISHLYMDMFMVYIREINGRNAQGSLYGSNCTSNLKKP